MSPLKNTVANLAFLVRKRMLLGLIVAAVFANLSFIAYAYYAGEAQQLKLNAGSPLKKRQIRQLQQQAAGLSRQQARSQRRADSAYAKTRAPEEDAARRQVIIQQLTVRYHALAKDTSIAAAAAVDYLRHYRPGPAAQL